MNCPRCGSELAAEGSCPRCAGSGQPSESHPTVTMGTWPISRGPAPAGGKAARADFQIDDVISDRYRVLERIGAGGMGAVYRVLDLTLDRIVALKTVHPALAERTEALELFKKELILARQVTHKNVCRVFDLGQDSGAFFLTMELIEGESLGKVTRLKQKWDPRRAAEIILQAANGLQAAHETGIIHRDLKPDNIMTQSDGRVLVMDFGIARPVEEVGFGFAGTPAYASPEQLLGEPQDHRSDLFSLGLIFFELLCGEPAFSAPKTIKEAQRRAKEIAPLVSERDPSIPRELVNIVERSLENDPEQRFSSARELAEALDAWLNPRPFYAKSWFTWSTAGAVAALAIGTVFWVNRPPPPPPTPVSVLIADFNNATREGLFDGTLEPAVQVALEGASFITAYDRGMANRLIGQLRPAQAKLDPAGARLVAEREGISAVLAGSIERVDDRYRISLRTINPADGKDLVREQHRTMDRDQILNGVGKLVIPIRQALGDRTPPSEQAAAAETFTAASLEAAQKYSEAQELASNPARREDAKKAYEEAIRLDPEMGRAYSGLAVVNRNLGQVAEALKNYELANSHVTRMSERERLRTLGGYYLTANNSGKSAEAFRTLVQKFPSDSGGHSNLALALLFLRQPAQALEEGRKAVELYPKNLSFRNNVALYAMYSGDYATSVREASTVLGENPRVATAYIALALSAAAGDDVETANNWYKKLAGVNPSMAATGAADLAVIQGRLEDAVKTLRAGIDANEAGHQTDLAARKYADLAQVYARMKHETEAREAAKHAVDETVDLGSLTEAALAYVDAGASAKAEELADKFRLKQGDGNQSTALLIDGYVQLAAGNVNAVNTLGKSKEITDSWLSHLLLGRADLAGGDFPGAYNEFQECLKRSGEATAAFLDEVPTARLIALARFYLGESEEGLKSDHAQESYQHFLKLQSPRSDDPLAKEAREKLERPHPSQH